jgi:hypothetical protein
MSSIANTIVAMNKCDSLADVEWYKYKTKNKCVLSAVYNLANLENVFKLGFRLGYQKKVCPMHKHKQE